MKKKIIKILTDLGFVDIDFEYNRNGISEHIYEVRYHNKKGDNFFWVDRLSNGVGQSKEELLQNLIKEAKSNIA